MIGRLPIAAGSRDIRNCPRYVRQARAADLVHLHSEEMFEGAEAHGVQSSLKRIRLTLERIPTLRLIP